MRRGRSGEDEAASAVYQVAAKGGAAANVGARRSQRLPERAHLHLDATGNARLIGQSAAIFSDYADPMRFINEKPCPETILQLDNFKQGGAVPVHAINGLDNYEYARVGVRLGCPPQVAHQFLEPVVRKDAYRRAAKARAIHETSVTKLVKDNHVAVPGQRGDRSQRCGIAA